MAVDTKFLNKFLLPMFAPETQPLINKLFDQFEKEPGASYNSCVAGFHFYLNTTDERSTAAVNGVVLGIFMCSLAERPEFKEMFEKCIAYDSKSKGENVVNIFDKQVDKR